MKSLTLIYGLCVLGIISSCDAKKNTEQVASVPPVYTTTLAFPSLPEIDRPVELTAPNDGLSRIFIVAQKGLIHVVSNSETASAAPVFLDIISKVTSGGETGLLGLAFHPNYKTNGYFYVNYTRASPLTTVISRFKVNASNPNLADPQSEEILLTYTQPYSNHNGGKLAFGPDGYLYIASGDGGSGGDPQGYAQNRTQLLGKILRIDVNSTTVNGKYGIPSDNPYKGNVEGFREEIYAYGLRNPWRFTFDAQDGMLWAADVGQNAVEEIDIIEKGGNYGWKTMEGEDCYSPSSNCSTTGLINPIWSYRQGSDGNSVTGGYVCRDKNLPGLNGKYIFGDFTSGKVWALTHAAKKAVKNEQIATLAAGLSSFGEDNKQNLYLLSYGQGKVYKLAVQK